MLGDQIYEGKGKITGTRVLDVDVPKMENSYMVQSKLKGIEVTETGTFTATMRSDGAQYGEDKALIMAQDGSGGTMMAHGIGRHIGADKISFRGLAIMGPANTGKLAPLNNLLVVFEAEVEGDNISIKGWEWK
jgi:hypothetical protein